MRPLTLTLLAAQKSSSRVPRPRVTVQNLRAGVVNLRWDRLYSGSEVDGPHAAAMTGNGSLVRLRTTPASDARKLFRQRVASPGPGADFSQWTDLNQYNVHAVAACALDAEVSMFWINSNQAIYRQRSPDNGVTWQAIDYPGYAPTGTGVTQAAAAYKPNGDLALFFTDTATLYLIKLVAGVWQSRTAWNKNTGDLSGVAVTYADGDWKLLVSGRDANGNYKVWSLVYGDGGEVAAGRWSDIQEIATAPADAGYEFSYLFLDRPDVNRCFYTEKYTGSQAYIRPFWSHTLPGTAFLAHRWREPVPFEMTGGEAEAAPALAHSNGYAWLETPAGVWRAALTVQSVDLSEDVLSARLELADQKGRLQIELNNAGPHELPGAQNSLLSSGCQIDFSPGYQTAAGDEYSTGLSFNLAAVECLSAPGQAVLILYAEDGWGTLGEWTARNQFRWNRPDQYGQPAREASVVEILASVLARCGLKLIEISISAAAAGFYPDFTVHPGDSGKTTIKQLLSFVPDWLFLEGNTAYLVNPLTSDSAVYSYSSVQPPETAVVHQILAGRYRSGAWAANRVRVEGDGVAVDSFAWPEIENRGDILERVADLNLTTAAEAQERGYARLRKLEIESANCLVRVPVNCGQQLYDVLDITDTKAGLCAAKRRVLGISLSFLPAKGEYAQKLVLGHI